MAEEATTEMPEAIPARTVRARDPELLTIQQIQWQFEELDNKTRTFALAWLNAKYGS